MQGFHHRGEFDPQEWANNLERRDKAKRRKYYRLIAKEKLRLAERCIDQALINAVCRYLATLKNKHGAFIYHLMHQESKQLLLPLWGEVDGG